MSGFAAIENAFSEGNAGMEVIKELPATEAFTVPCGMTVIRTSADH